jgi:NAD(P)-dependent dehydrogenase (short-subunit alcohol dehydrogenase family)
VNWPFTNKVALVTGAASGIGLVTAKAFAEAGAAVTLADVKEDAVRSAVEELVAAGHNAGVQSPAVETADASGEECRSRTKSRQL